MKSVALVPYCPWPADTGGKVEMWKHLEVLRELGPCTILSAASRPVGAGWRSDARMEVEARGFTVILREEEKPRLRARQMYGICYAALCKGLRLEKAFGHSNPYHRNAFPDAWWYRHTQNADLAVIHYSYWAWLPCACPKVIALLDIWSDTMWGGGRQEIKDLSCADLVAVISTDEQVKLKQRGVAHTVWSPPAVPAVEFPDSTQVGVIGSPSLFNQEGLRWVRSQWHDVPVHVYGGLAKFVVPNGEFRPVGRYEQTMDPYRECGIILMTTSLGMGVQIKVIEALAAGRAIIARRGAMRGLPTGDGAWLEVDTPDEMLKAAKRLQSDRSARLAQMDTARAYYKRYLDADGIRQQLKKAYLDLVNVKCFSP